MYLGLIHLQPTLSSKLPICIAFSIFTFEIHIFILCISVSFVLHSTIFLFSSLARRFGKIRANSAQIDNQLFRSANWPSSLSLIYFPSLSLIYTFSIKRIYPFSLLVTNKNFIFVV